MTYNVFGGTLNLAQSNSLLVGRQEGHLPWVVRYNNNNNNHGEVLAWLSVWCEVQMIWWHCHYQLLLH